jgi:hypothetical protein
MLMLLKKRYCKQIEKEEKEGGSERFEGDEECPGKRKKAR